MDTFRCIYFIVFFYSTTVGKSMCCVVVYDVIPKSQPQHLLCSCSPVCHVTEVSYFSYSCRNVLVESCKKIPLKKSMRNSSRMEVSLTLVISLQRKVLILNGKIRIFETRSLFCTQLECNDEYMRQ